MRIGGLCYGHPIVVEIIESKFFNTNITGACGALVIGCSME